MKNWQIYKRNRKTGIAEKAFKTWKPMTEKEADTVISKFRGTYQPIYTFFAAKIGSDLGRKL